MTAHIDPVIFCLVGLILLSLPFVFGEIKPHVGTRPPEHPPGWKNRKKTRKS